MCAFHHDQSQLVWHYTTLDVLQQILQGGYLLASEVSYQNDPSEPETAEEIIQTALSIMAGEQRTGPFARRAMEWLCLWNSKNGFLMGQTGKLVHSSRFILCASTDGDSLYAWRTYSGTSNQGCAIGLDLRVPLGLVSPHTDQGPAAVSPWVAVMYDEKQRLDFALSKLREVSEVWMAEARRDVVAAREQEKLGVAETEVDREQHSFPVLLNELPAAISQITAVAKHLSFADERESRITVSDAAHGVVFTGGANGPRPRVRITTVDAWGDVVVAPFQRLPIRSVILAPTASGEAERTTMWLLHANGYPLDPVAEIDESGPEPVLRWDSSQTVSIRRSKHPFRSV